MISVNTDYVIIGIISETPSLQLTTVKRRFNLHRTSRLYCEFLLQFTSHLKVIF